MSSSESESFSGEEEWIGEALGLKPYMFEPLAVKKTESASKATKRAVKQRVEDRSDDPKDWPPDPAQEHVTLKSRPKTTRPTRISTDILTDVCSTLQADGYLSQDAEVTLTRDMDALKEKLQFLENCLLPRGKFAHGTAEKAWKKCHAACSENISQLSLTLNLKTGAAFQLCLRLFQTIVQLNYKNSPTADKMTIITANVSKEDREVLHYIGGSIVHLVKGKVMGSQKAKEGVLRPSASVAYGVTQPPSASVAYDVLTEIIRHCKFETREIDDVIISQGERGDTLYIALQGDIGIYVNQKETFTDTDDKFNADVLQMVTKAAEMKHLDRNLLGVLVFGGSCLTFGEVALVEQDCIRTATVVANSHLELLTIDRQLFNRCLHGVVAEDMKAKADFIERNVMFRAWPSRQKKQLVISLNTEKVCYGDKIVKQGQDCDKVYFICSGEVEIHLEPKQYSGQFPRVWAEIEQFLPELISPTKGVTLTPHEDRINRLSPIRPQQICVLGENEHLGCMEVILGLDTFLETAVARTTVTLLKLRRHQFDRIFKRRYSLSTLDTIKNYLVQRLCLYIYQCPPLDAAFLKYLNIRLADAARLKSIKKKTFDENKMFSGADPGERGRERLDERSELMKRLHMPAGATSTMPAEDVRDVAMGNMNNRLKAWSLNSQLNGGKILRLQQGTRSSAASTLSSSGR